jgi:hypothetical protein
MRVPVANVTESRITLPQFPDDPLAGAGWQLVLTGAALTRLHFDSVRDPWTTRATTSAEYNAD